MRAKSFEEWIEGLPENTAGVKIRIGTPRSLPTISLIALPNLTDETFERFAEKMAIIRVLDREEMIELINEEAEAAGWPSNGAEVMRLHALTPNGAHTRSYQTTGSAQNSIDENGLHGVIDRLVDGILKSNAELRKSVDILTESLSHREDVLKGSIDSMLEAQQHAVETEASSLLTMIENAIPAEAQNDPLRQQAAGILGQIGQMFTGGGEGPLTADTIAQMMESNPEMVKDLINNERVKAAFMSAMPNNQASSQTG